MKTHRSASFEKPPTRRVGLQRLGVAGCALLTLLVMPLAGYAASVNGTLNAGGGHSGSATYTLAASLGEIAGYTSASLVYSSWGGFIGEVDGTSTAVTGATSTITVQATPANGGTVTGNGTYAVGTNIQILATANNGWIFTGWSDGNTNALQIVIVPPTNVTYTANFAAVVSGPPVIVSPPIITNAWLIVSNRFVVLVGVTNVFNVGATDPVDNSLLRYRWNFGDGVISSWSAAALATHVYAPNCGPYNASVTVSNTQFATSTNLMVSAACQLKLTALTATLNFAQANADSFSLTAQINLPGVASVTQLSGASLAVDLGDAIMQVTLDSNGYGVNDCGACTLVYTPPTITAIGYWTLTASFSNGSWRSQWAAYGLDNATHLSPGVSVRLPVAVVIGDEAFAVERFGHYTSLLNQFGTTGPVATPTISPTGGTFTNSVQITLSCATPSATIHYTTDGTDPDDVTDPDNSSPVYSSAISLTNSATLNAIAVATGYNASEIASASFIIVPFSVPTAVIAVHANPANGGTVSGGGIYPVGANIQITASANSGWAFIGWSDNTINATRMINVLLSGATYNAGFTQLQQTATISVFANPPSGGTVSGGGTFAVGTNVQISATASNGWTFTGWSDSNTNAVRTVTVLSGGTIYTADFVSQTQAAATHSSPRYNSPGMVIVTCQFTYPSGGQLLSLLWRPALPAGWTITGVSGNGNPELQGGEIVWTGTIPASPISIVYTASVPAGVTGPKNIQGTVEYWLNGQSSVVSIQAAPDPLVVSATTYHTADYADPRWVITGSEVNRVLAYWRAGVYHCDASQPDGYAPGSGATDCAYHNADYTDPRWVITGSEVNRVLAYWRAGGYHVDASQPDGFAPGASASQSLAHRELVTVATVTNVTISQTGPECYSSNGTFTVSTSFGYSGSLLSLLWRPQLTNEWTVTGVAGDGNPELQGDEIVWTGASIPASPVTMVYTVQVAGASSGMQQIRSEVEYWLTGTSNVESNYASPDPLELPVCSQIATATVTKLQVNLNFAKLKADSVSLTAKLDLPGTTNVVQLTSVPVVVDVGDAQVPFTLNNKGRGVSTNGTCVLAYTKPTKKLAGYWTLTAALSKETWYPQWAAYNLTNGTVKSVPAVHVTLPVDVLIGDEAFAAEQTLHYTSTKNKTGTAK